MFFDDVLDQLDACITVEAVFWVDLLDRDRLKIHLRSVRVLGLAGDGHGGIWELTCSNRRVMRCVFESCDVTCVWWSVRMAHGHAELCVS